MRRRFGIVPQETFLFSDTIRENIAFGFDDGRAVPDVEPAARLAGLDPGGDLARAAGDGIRFVVPGDPEWPARLGDLALISQSGAIAAALLEWGAQRDVGFSGVVSLGDKIDVDFGDCLDYFAQDRGTRAILLYVESINDPRKFMSAARAAARKPAS